MMGSQPNRDAVHGARQSLGYALDVMERTLAGQAYLASDTFSLADVCMMPGIQVIADAKQGDLLEQRPGVSRWWTEVARRHAWREVLARSQQ
jgi:glutathione S-transferase